MPYFEIPNNNIFKINHNSYLLSHNHDVDHNIILLPQIYIILLYVSVIIT